ncbi:MAG TPA: plastocyanin/azurin family copper-binding protein [Bacteroidia bacterium]|jgi:plastocyanin
MKKLYTLLVACGFSLASLTSNAATINVAVSNNTFTPQSFAAVVGDQIVFTLVAGSHNVTTIPGGTSTLPAGATPLNSGTMSSPGQTYTYTVAVAGNYAYQCTFHPGMVGGFAASVTGITDNTNNLLTSVYPSPFRDKVTVKYNGIEKIEFVNVVGELVKSIAVETQEGKLDVYFDMLPAGVYFYRTYREGTVAETRKIVKAK